MIVSDGLGRLWLSFWTDGGVLYFKDGSSYAVTNYWLADGKLHYIASYGGENAVDQKDLDLQKTVDENAAQGLTFTLHPGPVVSGGAMVVPQ